MACSRQRLLRPGLFSHTTQTARSALAIYVPMSCKAAPGACSPSTPWYQPLRRNRWLPNLGTLRCTAHSLAMTRNCGRFMICVGQAGNVPCLAGCSSIGLSALVCIILPASVLRAVSSNFAVW